MKCTIQNIPIHYEEIGSGIPVLCLHGFFVDHHIMKGCLEPIFHHVNGYKRVYIDLPGMGKTPAAENIKNTDDMLTLLTEFIQDRFQNQPFLLFGESYGGYLS